MESEHIVQSYDEELARLYNTIAEMGGLAEQQLTGAIDALLRRDREQAGRIIAGDKKVDNYEAEIDAMTIRMLALRQPMAEDLRIVIATLKIASNLERVGDYAKNIAKRAQTLSASPVIGNATYTLARMSNIVQGMIKNVLDSYLERDAHMAVDVRDRDEEVDRLHTSLFRELLTYMMEDPRNITPCTHLLFIAKNVERIGDHITGIAEQVYFMVQGEMLDDDRPKGDQTSFTVVEPNPVKKD